MSLTGPDEQDLNDAVAESRTRNMIVHLDIERGSVDDALAYLSTLADNVDHVHADEIHVWGWRDDQDDTEVTEWRVHLRPVSSI
jgi:hypothetical protein